MAAGASGGRWQAGQATQGEIPRAPRCCCRDAEIRLPSAAATSGPASVPLTAGTSPTRADRQLRPACCSGSIVPVTLSEPNTGLRQPHEQTAWTPPSPSWWMVVQCSTAIGLLPVNDRAAPRARPAAGGPDRRGHDGGRAGLGPVSECARRSRDTRLTLSGYSTAILQAGHSWRRYRPARTWPGSTLAEWQFAARDRARAI